MAINDTGISSTDSQITIYVAIPKSRNRWLLYEIRAIRDISGEDIMRKIRLLYDQEGRSFCWHNKHLGIRRPVVKIATIPSANVPSYPYEVTVTSPIHSPELSAAFHRPLLLRLCRPFAESFEDVLSDSPVRKAIVIGYETNKVSVAAILCITLIAAVAVGVALGIQLKRAELGIAASAGLFAMVSILEMLIFWMVK